jgi:hypothetical protein
MIGFRILSQEVPPESSANEHGRIVFVVLFLQSALKPLEANKRGRRKGPLHHLVVTCGGKIHPTEGWV